MAQHHEKISVRGFPGNLAQRLGNNVGRGVREARRSICQPNDLIERIRRFHREDDGRHTQAVLKGSQQLPSGKIFAPKQTLHIG